MTTKKVCCNLEQVYATVYDGGFTRCMFSDGAYNIPCNGSDIGSCPALKKYKREYEIEIETWQKRLDKVNKAIETKKMKSVTK